MDEHAALHALKKQLAHAPVGVIDKIAVAHALVALIAAPGHLQNVILPFGPKLHIFLVAAGGVQVAVARHKIAAVLVGLQAKPTLFQLFQCHCHAAGSPFIYADRQNGPRPDCHILHGKV